jgi:hypothetical protein
MKLAILLSLGLLVASTQAPPSAPPPSAPPPSAPPQTPPLAGQQESDPQLARIRSKMADNLRRLPNYTCLMTIERSFRPPGRVRDVVHQDTIRLEVAEVGDHELFGWPGSALTDPHMENFVPQGLIANGDFAGLANVLFRTHDPIFRPAGKKKIDSRETIGYTYEVPRGISHYELRDEERSVIVPYHGFVWVDPQSLDVARVELHLDGIPDSFGVHSSVTTIDYQKSRIGAGDFLLPARVQRVVQLWSLNGMRENVTTFSHCRQYETESAIRFDEPAASDTAPAAAATAPTEIPLPAGVRLPLKIETATDAKKAATGDPLVARLMEDVHVGTLVFPAGSEVRGRIHSLRWNERGPGLAELEFTELRTPKGVATFQGFVEGIEKHKGFSLGSLYKPNALQVDSRSFNLAGVTLSYRTIVKDK